MNHLAVECQLFILFVNHLSLVEQCLISRWDAAGFLFSMRDNSSAKLPYSIIIQPLVLFNAVKIVLYQPYAVSTAYFLVCVVPYSS